MNMNVNMRINRNKQTLWGLVGVVLPILALFLWLGAGGLSVYGEVDKWVEHEVTVPLRFDYYYSYDMVVTALKKLQQTYPLLTKLEIAGKSEEGRDIYCMTVNNPKTGGALEKPGIYVDGNIHGNEIQAGEVALYLLDYLLGNYGKNKDISALVDSTCFYVVPVVNVDGRYHFFADSNSDSSNRSLRIPTDDDRDGLVDEDAEDDLDGDGNICQMRKRDAFGKYKTDPDDPRWMVRVKPGEKAEWRLLGLEGIDNDGDDRLNEDGEGYVDGNRNWGFDWMPPYVQEGAGEYPFSSVGMKALAQFIRKRTNICVAWAFHNFGGMFLRGPSTKTQPEYDNEDVKVYDYLGYQAERITPGYRYLIGWRDLYSTYGDFIEWMTNINGCYSFTGELFVPASETFKTFKESQLPRDIVKDSATAPEEEEGGFMELKGDVQRERLKYNDHLTQAELFKPWTSFKHPTYGDIEIGGWVKSSTRLPAPFMIKDMAHRNASVIIFSAKQTPRVTMEIYEKKKIGPELYRIRVRLVNTGAIPTVSYGAQKDKLYPLDMLKVSGNGVKVVAGGVLKDSDRDLTQYKEFRPELQFLFVPGFGKVEYQFLISGNSEVRIFYSSYHAGKVSHTFFIDK